MCSQSVKTPCVGLCSTVYGDLVCRGCKRYHHEIINWNLYGESEKTAVLKRLEVLLVQVVSSKLEVFDQQLLQQQLEKRRIQYEKNRSCYCWVHQLLVKGARRIGKVESYGIRLFPEFSHISLPDLREMIDREYFLLSEAHYERYVVPKHPAKKPDAPDASS